LANETLQPPSRDGPELAVRGSIHHRPCAVPGEDFRVRHALAGVPPPPRQKVVGPDEDGGHLQVEVGEHRGPPGSAAREGTADFDPPRLCPVLQLARADRTVVMMRAGYLNQMADFVG
jgi:hypothetical protein